MQLHRFFYVFSVFSPLQKDFNCAQTESFWAGSPILSCLPTGKQSSWNKAQNITPSGTVFLKGSKGNKQIFELFLSSIGDYLPAAPKFLTSQSNQSFIFCELTGTLHTQKGTFMVSQDVQGASDQEVRQRIDEVMGKNLFLLMPVRGSHEYFPRRPNFEADGQDICTVHPWKTKVPHGTLRCKSFNWGRYKTKNALEKELNVPAWASEHHLKVISNYRESQEAEVYVAGT